jgi:hypothetical protein
MPKKGAYVYALKVRYRKLGSVALGAVRKAGALVSGPVRGTGLGRRVDGCLKWAMENAQVGSRNEIGRWLCWRSTDAGLDEDQTMKVMTIYREAVPDPRSYTAREVIATVRSRFRRLALA